MKHIVLALVRLIAFVCIIPILGTCGWSQSQKTLEQIPDLKSIPDSTLHLQDQIDDPKGQGNLKLSEKRYRITKPLIVDLARHGAIQISAAAGSTIIMDGPGPAIKIVGSHDGTASPKTFMPKTWNQRMPSIRGLEILGAHPLADGIELDGTVAAVVDGVSVRWCRHGIHLVNRNRNVVIANSHLYENSGIGIFLNDVNLHQINVTGAHISYNRAGGIVVRDGNVRNLQVSGCDIEANMPDDGSATTTANVLIDVSGSPNDKSKSIAEVSITGCTIQHAANYGGSDKKGAAPGGANIRLAGKQIYPIDSVTITGNVLSDTTTNTDIRHAQDIAINGNNFFAPKEMNLRVRDSERVNVVGNTFNPRQFVRPGTILLQNCSTCIVSNSTMHQFATKDGALIIKDSQHMLVANLILSKCGSGIRLINVQDSFVQGCIYRDLPQGATKVSLQPQTSSVKIDDE